MTDAATRIAELEQQLEAALAEAAHWKANHDNQVSRARILIERPDVPLERVAAYHELAILRAAAAERCGRPSPATIERETTAAAIEGAIRIGQMGNVAYTTEESWITPFVLIGADIAIHDRLRACVMAIIAQLRSNDFVPGRAASIAPGDREASALDALLSVALNRKNPNALH